MRMRNRANPLGWQDRAACAGTPIEWWFPSSRSDINVMKAAIAVCGHCPVKADCLDYALSDLPTRDHGIWAGTTPEQRYKLGTGHPKR